MAKKKAALDVVLELPVTFGNVNIGDATARVSVAVERKHLTLTQADKHLCNKRLTATIQAHAGNNRPDQQPMFDAGVELLASWDTHSFGVSAKKITFGLTCVLKSVDIDRLAHFAKRAGAVLVHDLGDIPDEPKDGDDAEEDEDE